MKQYIYYSSYDLAINPNNQDKFKEVPQRELFKDMFNFFGQNITMVDRTGQIKFPIKTHVLDNMKMPDFQVYTKSFEEICDERAEFLYKKAKESGRKIVVMYSGGIDSTAILCSFIRTRTDAELKEDFLVLMSGLSVEENRNFANDFVFKKFNIDSSYKHPYYLGNDKFFFITGENADQLFGSQINDNFASYLGNYDAIFQPIDDIKPRLIEWMSRATDDDHGRAERLFALLERFVKTSKVEIKDFYSFFWWLNFSTKWQSVYVRLLAYTKNLGTVKLEENYTTFYHTNDFQLWSMNNVDNFNKFKNQYSVKYPAKEYIFTVFKDEEYMKKRKVGSLWRLAIQKPVPYAIYIKDNKLYEEKEYLTKEYYNFDTDF